MGISDLFSKIKGLAEDDAVKSVVKKVASNKKVQSTISKAKSKVGEAKVAAKISKIAKVAGIDLSSILSLAMKNQDVINILGKLGLKKKEDPASSAVQKLVGNLKTTISKVTGTKFDDNSFKSIVNKLLGNATVKSKVEKLAGTGINSFIKKAVAEYIS